MAKQNLGGVYANMDFPAYEWKEFPKAVTTGPHGQYVVVQSAIEESEVRSKLQKDQDDAPAIHIPYVADPEKEILISRARELGVAFNPKWSKAKLQVTVNEAEREVDSLPAELPKKKSAPVITTIEPEIELHNESPEDTKARLVAEVKALGINPTGIHLWGIPRLKAAIAEAQG